MPNQSLTLRLTYAQAAVLGLSADAREQHTPLGLHVAAMFNKSIVVEGTTLAWFNTLVPIYDSLGSRYNVDFVRGDRPTILSLIRKYQAVPKSQRAISL